MQLATRSLRRTNQERLCCLFQATVRAPPERNMTRRTLPFMYGVGIPPFLLISFICYWAYGNEVAPNVLDNLSGPKWAVALAYIAGAAQIIVSFHVRFVTPGFCVMLLLVHVSQVGSRSGSACQTSPRCRLLSGFFFNYFMSKSKFMHILADLPGIWPFFNGVSFVIIRATLEKVSSEHSKVHSAVTSSFCVPLKLSM